MHPDMHLSFPVIGKSGESGGALSTSYLAEFRQSVMSQPYFSLAEWLQQMEAGNRQASISRAECYDLTGRLSLTAYTGSWKIILMWMPEFLGQAGNVLLKMLEEPSPGTLFFLVASRTDHILPTVVSRAQTLRIPPVEMDEVARAMVELHGLDQNEALSRARLAEGSLVKMRQLIDLDDEDGTSDTLFMEMMRLSYSGKVAPLMAWLEQVSDLGREGQKKILLMGLELLRACLLELHGVQSLQPPVSTHQAFITGFSRFLDVPKINRIYKQLQEALLHLERNANVRLLFHALVNRLHETLRPELR
jgi:DNA polymerase-3 subunit delta'